LNGSSDGADTTKIADKGMESSSPNGRRRLGDRLDALYANRFPDADRREKTRLWSVLCSSFFARYVARNDTVLDVGAGYCDFVNHVTAARRIAVDVNPDTGRYAAPGVEVHRIELARLDSVVAARSVDLAFASNVLEHMRSPDELLAVLEAVHAVLKPGGRLLVLQPNVRHVGAAFWDFFDHTLPLTEKGMAEALGVAGFQVREVRSRFLPYTTRSAVPKWSWLVRAYLAVPPLQWAFGKQMLVLAEKPRE
jgi:SAM-dependent methyltransferase